MRNKFYKFAEIFLKYAKVWDLEKLTALIMIY